MIHQNKTLDHFFLPFPDKDEDLPRQAAVSTKATTVTIDSTYSANINNNTVNDSSNMLIPSNTPKTATNNRTKNENANVNIVSDSSKLLTPTGTSTTTTNNNKNSSNTNNSKNNTCSKLIPSRIDEERNTYGKCEKEYGTKQHVKEKIQILNSD